MIPKLIIYALLLIEQTRTICILLLFYYTYIVAIDDKPLQTPQISKT